MEKPLKGIILKAVAVLFIIVSLIFSYLSISLSPVIPLGELSAIRNDLKNFAEEYRRNMSHARYDFVKKIFSDCNKKDPIEKLSNAVSDIRSALQEENSEFPSEACALFDKYIDLPEKLEPVKAIPEGIVPYEKHPDADSEMTKLLCILRGLRTCAKIRNECDEVLRIQQIESVLHSEMARNSYSNYYVIYQSVYVREIVEFVRQNKTDPGKALKHLDELEKLIITPKASWDQTRLKMYKALEMIENMSDSGQPFKMFESDTGCAVSENAEILNKYFPWLEKKIFLSGMIWIMANDIVTYQHLSDFRGDVFKSGSAVGRAKKVRSKMNYVGFEINTWVWGRFMWHEPDDLIGYEKKRQMLTPCTRVILAIEMFRKKEKRLPANLTELLPGYLKDIPKEISYKILNNMNEYRIVSPAVSYDSKTGEIRLFGRPLSKA